MKKRVSAELISIAHRILKLKNHSETLQLQQEAKNLYDQLTILRFYEENFEMLKNEIPATVIEEMLEAKPTAVFSAPVEVKEEELVQAIDLVFEEENEAFLRGARNSEFAVGLTVVLSHKRTQHHIINLIPHSTSAIVFQGLINTFNLLVM